MKIMMAPTILLAILLGTATSFAKVENMSSLIRQTSQEQAVAYRNLEKYFGFDHSVKVAKQLDAEAREPVDDSDYQIRLISRK